MDLNKYINICFIIDESGSMASSVNDVKGGFMRMIEEQKNIKDGKCTVSLFKFDSSVTEVFVGKDVSEINEIEYKPWGSTAMNDGIGTAINKIGKWLSDMKEEERPSKNLIVIMTDGEENASKEFTFSQIREMIKHQEEKYNWSFVYMGSDLTSMKEVNNLGIRMSAFSSKANLGNSYDIVNKVTTSYRCANSVMEQNVVFDAFANDCLLETANYEKERGIKLEK